MKQSVNLVPDSFRRAVVARRLLRSWLMTSMVTGIVLIAYVAWERDNYTRTHNRRLVVESKARPFSEMSNSATRMEEEIRLIDQNDALVHRLSKDQTPLLPLALVSAGVKACPDQLWIKRVKFEQHQKVEKPAAGAPAATSGSESVANGQGRLILEGLAVDNLAVAAFVAALRDTKGFRSVELKSSVVTQVGDQRQMSFSIESEL
jgi:hypothetical protein